MRSAAGVMGLDPFVLYRNAISQTIPYASLVLAASLGLAGFIGLGWAVLRRSKLPYSQRWFLFAAVALPLLMAVVIHGIWQVALSSRYFLAQTVPLAVLVAGWMVTWPPRPLALMAMALIVLGVARAGATVSRPHEEWREAVAFVDAHQQPGDVLVFTRAGVDPYVYYAHQPLPTVELDAFSLPPGRVRSSDGVGRILCQTVTAHRRVWIVDDQYYAYPQRVMAVQGWLVERAYRLQERQRFTGITMSLYAQAQEGSGLTAPSAGVKERGWRRPCP